MDASNSDEFLRNADSLYSQGYKCYCSKPQKLDEAINLLKRAAELYSELGNIDGQVKALKYLGDAYGGLGDNTKALCCYQQVIGMENKCDPQSYEMQYALNLIGMHYYRVNDYKQALQYAMRSFAIQKRRDILSKHADTGYNFGIIGKLHLGMGNSTQALEFFLKGVNILERSGDPESNLGNIHLDLATIYKTQGDYAKSIYHYDKALELGAIDKT